MNFQENIRRQRIKWSVLVLDFLFAPGSMLPKVEACIEYVRAFPEGKALITSLECAAAGLEGKTGTVITA